MIFSYSVKYKNGRVWPAWDDIGPILGVSSRFGWKVIIGEQVYRITRNEARVLLKATRCFVLRNKPGMIIFGTDETYKREEEEGYAPWDVKPVEGDGKIWEEIWIDMGEKYFRTKSVYWPNKNRM